MSKSIQLKEGNENCYPTMPYKAIRVTFGQYGGNALLARCGNIVTFTNNADLTNIPYSVLTIMATLPIGYRPIEELQTRVTNDLADFRILVYTNGNVNVYRGGDVAVVNGAFSLTWITNDPFPS